jgi:hypothetical protein
MRLVRLADPIVGEIDVTNPSQKPGTTQLQFSAAIHRTPKLRQFRRPLGAFH